MQEANVVSEEIAEAGRAIAARESLLRRSEERMHLVMRELSHRSLNLLTVVQLIAKQSGRLAPDHAHFMEGLNKRIAGLARSHDLLISTEWNAVSLKDLVAAQLSAFIPMPSERVEVDGPALMLRSQAVQHLGMGLHELATNALKYGALSVPEGRISVTWVVKKDANGAEQLQFRWTERDGPAVKATNRTGFGLSVTEALVPSGLDGKARTELREDGLVWELNAPLASLVDIG